MATVNLDVYTKTHGSPEALRDVEDGLDRVEKQGGITSERLKGIGTAATVMGGAILAAFGVMIKQASEAEEIESKFFAVFKEESGAATQFINTFADSVGRSRIDLMEWMATLQDTFVPLGFARSEANQFSQTLTTLAVDLASFNNQAEPDVIRDLQSAIVGNHETMRKYGVIINEATINQELLNMGISQGSKNASAAEKAQARLNIIMKGTADAQGDAARTSGSFANQVRMLQAQWRDLSVEIGSTVMPMIAELVQKITATIKKILEWIKAHPELAKKIAATALKVGALLAILGPILIIIPKLVAGIVMLKGAFIALAGPIGLVTAAATTAYLIFNKLKKAKEELAEATARADAQEKRLMDKLKEAADAAGMTRAEFHQLSMKYGENAAALAMAIKHGKEGVELQNALAEVGRKNVEEWKKCEDATKGYAGALDPKLTSASKKAEAASKELAKLIKTMTDEVKKHTLDEFNYRKQKALEIYNERKALLDKEGADKGAYVLLEQSYNVQLTEIEKDRTEMIKEQQEARAKAIQDYYDKQRDLYQQAEGLAAGYTDEVMRLTLSENEYKLWALEQWYKTELQKLEGLKQNYAAYTMAKEALDQAYNAKTVQANYEITQQISEHWQQVIDGLSNAFGGFVERILQGGTSLKDNLKMMWEDVKQTFIGVLADMAREWMANFIKQLITGATQAGASITSSLGTAVSSLTTGLTSLVTSVAQSLVAVAQAIATAAQILASAAAALVKVGLIAIALYAAFNLVKGIINKLLGGGGAGDVVYWLKAIREVGEVISWGTDWIRYHGWDVMKKLNEAKNSTQRIVEINKEIRRIAAQGFRDVVKAIQNTPGAQRGEVVMEPGLRRVGEQAPRIPEIIAPEPMFKKMVESAAGKKAGEVNLQVTNEFHFADQVDPNFTEQFVRKQVMPHMLDALDVNYLKTLLKEKLGI